MKTDVYRQQLQTLRQQEAILSDKYKQLLNLLDITYQNAMQWLKQQQVSNELFVVLHTKMAVYRDKVDKQYKQQYHYLMMAHEQLVHQNTREHAICTDFHKKGEGLC